MNAKCSLHLPIKITMTIHIAKTAKLFKE